MRIVIVIVIVIVVLAAVGIFFAIKPSGTSSSPATSETTIKSKTGMAACFENPKKWYLDNNPDVAETGIDAFLHWCSIGKKENRQNCFVDQCPKSSSVDLDPNSTTFAQTSAHTPAHAPASTMTMSNFSEARLGTPGSDSSAGSLASPTAPGGGDGVSEDQLLGNMKQSSRSATASINKQNQDNLAAQKKARDQFIEDMQNPNKGFTLCSAKNQWCVENGGEESQGHAIAAFPNESGRDRNKLWFMIVRPDGWYTFRNVATGQDFETGGADSQGRVRAYSNDTADNKRWRWNDEAKTLCNKQTGGCIYPNETTHEVGVKPLSQSDDSFKWVIGLP